MNLMEDLFADTRKKPGYKLMVFGIKLRVRFTSRCRHIWSRIRHRFPFLYNEGEATAAVVNMAFNGYPMEKDFATKEEAVTVLQAIWDIVDNWDGSRINVKWMRGEDLPDGGVAAWARRKV